jgi:mRNA-degrading endonuclease RelE of RelBE toxin-antitoxin system
VLKKRGVLALTRLILGRRNKYGARKTIISGITFDSAAEAEYYLYLLAKQQAGEISNFRRQPRYRLQDGFTKNGKRFRPIDYVADFEVVDKHGRVTVVDVKGRKTEAFGIKRKLFEAKYPDLELVVVKKKRGGWVEEL